MRHKRDVKGANNPLWTLMSALFVALLIAAGCTESKVEYPERHLPAGLETDTSQIKLGQTLFANKCASCHGKPSEGRSDRAVFFEPPAPDFTDMHYKEVDPAYLFWRIEIGKTVEPYQSQGSVMPAWGAYFSEEQIWQIVAYLRFRAH